MEVVGNQQHARSIYVSSFCHLNISGCRCVKSLVLVVLSHDLPTDTNVVTGLPLALSKSGVSEGSAPIVQLEDWADGGPGIQTIARPWAMQTVPCDAVEGRIGSLTTDTVNNLSIQTQVYLRPVR